MMKRDRKEYLREWWENKKLNDPEYAEKYKENRKEYSKQRYLELSDEDKKMLNNKSSEYARRRRKIDPIGPMINDARKRAERKGIDFDLDQSDLIVPPTCPVLGIELFVSGGKRTANSPSLDRIDNSRGYIKSNVRVISFRANALKNDATIEELEKIVNYMKENLCHGLELIKKLENV